ncbi:MAG: TetR/AcrR family transcriptional regulator [Clostridia bacterium]|nr:TetR/AcrR family transcriptional regulator [Clostridia bacterium]
MQYLKEEVRGKILLAAREEFKTHGYSNASIRNIAEMSQTSLGNIYRYFTDKEAVFLAVVGDLFQASVDMVERYFDLDMESLSKYPDILITFNEQYAEQLTILKSGLRKHYFQYIQALVKVYARKLEEHLKQNSPLVADKIKSAEFYEDIAHAFMHGLYHAQGKEVAYEQKKQNIRELLWFFFAGVDKRFAYFPDQA